MKTPFLCVILTTLIFIPSQRSKFHFIILLFPSFHVNSFPISQNPQSLSKMIDYQSCSSV